MTIADAANKFEQQVISQMSDEMYSMYMSLTREQRAEIVYNAMHETVGALK